MIKHCFIFAIQKNDPIGDRFYFRFHSKECVRYFGPWLTRYETYRSFDVPDEPALAPYGLLPTGRVTELWYRSVEEWIEADPNRRPFTAPPGGWQRGTSTVPRPVVIVPAMPTEDFLGKAPTPEEFPIVRWYQAIKYPDGVPVDEGEKWYKEVFAPEAKTQTDLLRFASWRAPANSPIQTPWLRITEMWYPSVEAWHKAAIESPPRYTRPKWAKGPAPFVDMGSILVPFKPQVDFLKDNPLIP
jgi:hypothetical protein